MKKDIRPCVNFFPCKGAFRRLTDKQAIMLKTLIENLRHR